MAQAQTLKYSTFLIQLGSGSPTVYASPCGLNSKGFSRTAATNDTNVPDCDDPDAPSWLERDVVSLSGQMTGAGVVADEDFDVWNDWFESGASLPVQIKLGTRTWQGNAILSKLDVTASRGQRVNFSATIDSDGEILKL
ncbi:Phage major tail protein 2 [Bradyrhizobium sp. YR681]|uniref:phage tail tube protein n=1 Tax=Bradyrhizobium sp. YR681 TaxID=1144344 RepID=UPI0002711493|nr:phage tail tube protein [Bradyrhizobium sp. YR681]EJN11855.1 Phage major tail protein 2 [Bradyrhizobium sp. YR681]